MQNRQVDTREQKGELKKRWCYLVCCKCVQLRLGDEKEELDLCFILFVFVDDVGGKVATKRMAHFAFDGVFCVCVVYEFDKKKDGGLSF